MLGSIVRGGALLALLMAGASACSKSDSTNESGGDREATHSDAALAPSARPKPAPKREDQRPKVASAELPPVVARGTLLQRVPKNAPVAMRFPHVEKLKEAWERTPLFSLMQLPQFEEQQGQINEAYEKMWSEVSKQFADADKLKAKILRLEGEVVIAITSFDARALEKNNFESDLPVSVALMLEAGRHADGLQSVFDRVFEEAARKKDVPQFELVTASAAGWHRRVVNDLVCVDLARDGSQFLLEFGPKANGLRDGAPLPARALEDSFAGSDIVRATPDLAKDGSIPVAELYINLAPLWTACELLAPAEVKTVLQGSGATSIGGISIAAGLGKSGLDELLMILSPSGKDLLTQVLTNRPLDPKIARYIPSDSAMASLSTFDFAALFDGVMKLVPPMEKKQAEQMLAGMKSEGFDLRGDLLGNIGPTFGCSGSVDFFKLFVDEAFKDGSATRPSNSSGALDFTLLVELQDAPRFKKMVDRLLRSSGAAAHVRPEVVQGEPTSRLEAIPIPRPDGGGVFAVIEPSWHIGDHALVFSTSNASLERALAAAKSNKNRGPERMKEALEKHAAAAWAISTNAPQGNLPGATSLGLRTGLGLELVSREGPGTTSAYLLGAGCAMVASVAIPNMMSARLGSNEQAAIATLRNIGSAQAQFRATGCVDQDGDGRGEFGTLGELTGSMALLGGKPALSPPMLSATLVPDSRGCVTKAGYVFRVDVPRRAIGGADAAEQRFVAYAWPLAKWNTGGKVYVIDATGKIFFSDNRGMEQGYEGDALMPATDASELRDETDRVAGVTAVRRGRDGGIWLELE